MKFSALVEMAYRRRVVFECEGEAPAQVAIRTALDEGVPDEVASVRVVEIVHLDP